MPNITGATNFFPKAYENTVPMTLGGSILAGAATVPVNGMTNYTDGDVICFVVDGATPALKQVFTGTKSGANIINAVWTEFPTGGVNVAHSAGATVIDYVSATHWDLFQKGATQSINQDGSLKTAAVQTALNITGGAAGGWTPTGFTPNTVVANGNRSYTLTFNAHDLTTQLTPGMRLQMIRTVTAPTQCTSLNGTTQFYSRASGSVVGMTFTNNFVVSAWVKLSSYPATNAGVISRYNGTSGWIFYIGTTGQVNLAGFNAGAANSAISTSYQSIPLNKWVHVAAQLDMTTTSTGGTNNYILIDGVEVPNTFTRAGTSPTALIQAGNLEIGSFNAGGFFPGKIAQAAIFSAKVTEATILASMPQGLAGTETSLISAYSFNNSINDLNANANNLTANGSVVATTADTPFTQTQTLTGFVNGTTNYGIVMAASFSTNTTCVVQVAEGDTIPTTGGVSAVSYATNKVPYGMPVETTKWDVATYALAQQAAITLGAANQYTSAVHQLNIPIGSWVLGYEGATQTIGTTASLAGWLLSPATPTNAVRTSELYSAVFNGSAPASLLPSLNKTSPVTLSAATPYILYGEVITATGTVTIAVRGDIEPLTIRARSAYL